jgi:hypothetical protein
MIRALWSRELSRQNLTFPEDDNKAQALISGIADDRSIVFIPTLYYSLTLHSLDAERRWITT